MMKMMILLLALAGVLTGCGNDSPTATAQQETVARKKPLNSNDVKDVPIDIESVKKKNEALFGEVWGKKNEVAK